MSANLRLVYPFDLSNSYAMNTLPSERTRHEKYAFGSFDGRDTLCSKNFALKPCNKKSSRQRRRKEKLKAPELLNANAKCPQKKRKYDQYLNGEKFATTLELITGQKYGDQNTIINDTVEYCSVWRQDCSYPSDFDEFIERPNSMKQEHLKNHLQDLVTSSNYTSSTDTSIKGKPTIEISKVSLLHEHFDNSGESKHSLSSKKDDMELNQPPDNSLSSEDNHIPRAAIPIGPSFQAVVPKWEGTKIVRHHNSDEDLKWLGIQFWPMPNITKSNTKGIEEGRPDSCSCECPGSIDCVKLHVSEARECLKLKIGTTFSSWKFDEMGEDFSTSWTLEEQKEFESLVKLNPLSKDTNFWKLAMMHFPSKSLKCLVNYYHNVYIPRHLSLETRSSFGAVDSDDDQDENYKKKNDGSHTGIIIVHVANFFIDDQFYLYIFLTWHL